MENIKRTRNLRRGVTEFKGKSRVRLKLFSWCFLLRQLCIMHNTFLEATLKLFLFEGGRGCWGEATWLQILRVARVYIFKSME